MQLVNRPMVNERRLRFVFILGLAVLAACSKKNDVSQVNNTYDGLPTVTINSDGGQLAGDHGLVVDVPPGAVDQETTLAGGAIDGAKAPPLPTDVASLGFVFALEPHGQTFQKPVTITIPFATQGAAMKLYTAAPDGAWTEVAGAAPQGTALRAQVAHFSFFVVVSQDPCFSGGKNAPDGTTCGGDKVCKAGACITCAAGGACALGQGECKAGVLSCATGAPLCVPGAANLDDGTACGAKLFCVGGTCKACNDGDTCTVAGSECKVAAISCKTGSAVCEAQPGDIANGTACGTDKVCFDGLCAACTAGKACTGTNACKETKTSCASGQELCAETGTDNPAGTACGAGHVCLAGTCQVCDAGAACVDPAAPCKAGAIACNTGSPVCHATATDLSDGTVCGTGKVCAAGMCNTCAEGVDCTPSAAPCKTGKTSCATGTSVCQAQTSDVTNGTTCGTDQVCLNGSCSACVPNQACTTANVCRAAKTSCASGQQLCVETGSDLAAGTACGAGHVCLTGTCQVCDAGVACVAPAAPCKVAAIACNTGSAVCQASTTNIADGTSCGTDKVCGAGACNACVQGAACVIAATPCAAATVECSSGASVCTDRGTLLADGTSCGTGKACDATGQCITRDGTLNVTSGASGSAMINQTVPVVALKLLALDTTPIANRVITVTVPPGAAISPAQATTTSQGAATFSLRVGRVPGPYKFTFTVSGAPTLDVTATATEPPAGTVIPVVNASNSTGVYATATSAVVAPTGTLEPTVAVAPDGTLYVAVSSAEHIFRVTPAGVWSHVAGDLAQTYSSTNTGDGGSAKLATFAGINALAVDAPRQLLYVATSGTPRVVRVVDLAHDAVDRYAGGGTQNNGDGGPATDAQFSSPDALSVGPDGTLYVQDSTTAIRAIDPVSTVITTWQRGTSTLLTGSTYYSHPVGAPVVDAAGDAVLPAYCTGGYCVVRRSAGKLSLAAGAGANVVPASGAITAVGVALASLFPLASDPAGNLFAGKPGSGVIGIDLVTSRATRTIGDLTTSTTTGDFGLAKSATTTAQAIGMDAAGHLYVVEGSQVRQVWKVGSTTPTAISIAKTTGDGESALASDFGAPITATVRDAGGQALSNVTVRWSSTDGAVVQASSQSDASGVVSTSVQLGVEAGTYAVDADVKDLYGRSVAGVKQTFSLTATAPAAGQVTALFNAGGSSGAAVVPGPALASPLTTPYGMAFADDGSYFVVSDNQVLRVSKSGYATLIAGVALNGTSAGDGGPALDATISPEQLAYDGVRGRLYLTDWSARTVRSVDLATGIITRVGGGGTAAGPGYGDGGPATSAALGNIDTNTQGVLAVGPDGAVYVRSQSRIRRIEPTLGSIATWFDPATYTSPTLSLNCGNHVSSGPVFDAAGNAYFVTDAYGVGLGAPMDNNASYCTAIIARRATDGTVTRVAGNYAAAKTLLDVLPTEVGIATNTVLAVNAVGDVAYSTSGQAMVKRIDPITGNVVAVLGTGTVGTPTLLSSALTSRVGSTTPAVVFDPAGRLAVIDYDTSRALRVW